MRTLSFSVSKANIERTCQKQPKLNQNLFENQNQFGNHLVFDLAPKDGLDFCWIFIIVESGPSKSNVQANKGNLIQISNTLVFCCAPGITKL